MIKVFVDGQEGTTGLQIRERLLAHAEVELLEIDPAERKNTQARAALLNAADVAFLCLPDVAAKESVALVNNPSTRIIDASTAHRTHPDWAYGLPELNPAQREKIRASKRIAVPGCHATGFILLMHPLIAAGLLPADAPISCHSLTGYSGGGKTMIAEYESPDRAQLPPSQDRLKPPRPYALGLTHKHLPEMQRYAGLSFPPVFMPIAGDFYKGMAVCVPLHARMLKNGAGPKEVHAELTRLYAGETNIRVMPLNAEPASDPVNTDEILDAGFFPLLKANDTNYNDIFIFSNADRFMLISRLDNLGKGASGAAVQCMGISN